MEETMRRSKKNENSDTMDQVQALRLELKKIKMDIEENEQQQEAAKKRYQESRDGDLTVHRARAYLDGQEMPSQSHAEEARILADRAEVLKQAHQIKTSELQPLLSKASQEHKATNWDDFLECQRQKYQGIAAYKAACDREEKIRDSFKAEGLIDTLERFGWPGLDVSNFDRTIGVIEHRMKAIGLSKKEFEYILKPLK
jgi:hypothetical protein